MALWEAGALLMPPVLGCLEGGFGAASAPQASAKLLAALCLCVSPPAWLTHGQLSCVGGSRWCQLTPPATTVLHGSASLSIGTTASYCCILRQSRMTRLRPNHECTIVTS